MNAFRRGRKSWGSSRPKPSWRHRPSALPAWDTRTEIDKQVGARWVEVFTGAVEYTDYQIGRVLDAIAQTGDLDNTLVIYIAGDNGPTVPPSRRRGLDHLESAGLPEPKRVNGVDQRPMDGVSMLYTADLMMRFRGASRSSEQLPEPRSVRRIRSRLPKGS